MKTIKSKRQCLVLDMVLQYHNPDKMPESHLDSMASYGMISLKKISKHKNETHYNLQLTVENDNILESLYDINQYVNDDNCILTVTKMRIINKPLSKIPLAQSLELPLESHCECN